MQYTTVIPLLVALMGHVILVEPCLAQREAASVTTFVNIEDVVKKHWTESKQLYVRGNIGVGQAQLRELANWLRENGPHWTVVLMDTAKGQSYTSANGVKYYDAEAVDIALGKGLSNETGFGQLLHPDTQEADGAVFALFLREEQISYFASDAQDSRDLGEAHWAGELNQPAARAMRSGGRIVDAVKNTITNINGKLDRTIANEKNARIQKEQQRLRMVAHVQGELTDLRASISEVVAASAAFVAEFPKATGPLAKPPTQNWLEKVTQLESQLTADTATNVDQQHAVLTDEVSRFLNAYAAKSGIQKEQETASGLISALDRSTSSQAKAIGQTARGLLAKSSQQLESGEIEFMNTLADTQAELERGQQVMAEEEQRLRLVEMRNRWIRATAIIIFSLVALVIAALLWLANRRRSTTMTKALEQVASRIQSIAAETERLDKLFQRNEDILGSRDNLQQRGYVGTTQQLATRALDYVDDLFIMSKEVKRVVREAQQLIHPSDAWSKLVNLFSATRYQQAIDHVTGAPLKFTRVTGIPLIVRDMGIGQISATSESGIPDEVSLSFDDIFGALQQRGTDAQQALSTIEDCLANIQDKLTQAQKTLEAATTQEKTLDSQAAQDGTFDVPNYFTALLPSVQDHLKKADDLSAFDAVQAVQGPLATAERQLNEAMQLGRYLITAREQLFPKLTADAQSLKQRGYTSSWINDQLLTITRMADGLYKQAVSQSISQDNELVLAEINNLTTRSTRVVELASQLDDQLAPEVKALESAIADTRADVATKLNLQPSQILQELDRNPDDELARAHSSIAAGKAMLLQGRVHAVEEAIATYQTAKQVAESLLESTKNAVKVYSSRRQDLLQGVQTSQARTPQLKRGIEEARNRYAASALIVNPNQQQPSVVNATIVDSSAQAKPVTVAAGRSMDWYLSQAMDGHRDIERLIAAAQTHHGSGEILKAAEELIQAKSILDVSDNQLQQIEQHLQLLDSQSRENIAQQQRNELSLENLLRAERNPKVTATTLTAISRAQAVVDGNRRLIQSQELTSNPFETAQVLVQAQRQLEQLQAQIVGDEQAHAEARRAAVGARQQLEQANQLVRQSQSDGIPDSPEIIQTNSRIAELTRYLRDVENDLEIAHGDWLSIDARAARIQTDLASATKTLGSELSNATQALAAFQQASQLVLQASRWSGPWGVRVPGSPGVDELERARRSLQSGNYNVVLQISQIALMAAQAAIQQAEREVARRRMEEERQREAERRAQAEASRRHSPNFGNGGFSLGSSGHSSSSSSTSSSSSSSSTTNSAASGSGFSRTGW